MTKCVNAFLTVTLLSLTSCANITPKTGTPTEASFDGNTQNSGIVSQLTEIDENGKERPTGGYVITESALQRYNSYIDRYGSRFSPPLKQNFGTTKRDDGNYNITKEGTRKWYQMILEEETDKIRK